MKQKLILFVLCVAALSLFGVVMLYSTVHKPEDAHRFNAQLRFLGAGWVLLPLLFWLDYGWLNRRPVLLALAGICGVLLIAVLIPGVGVRSHGARRWLPGLGQPSEFAKPALIILLAAGLARRGQEEIQGGWRGFLTPLLIGGAPALLIFAEPDWGTALLLGMLTFALLLLADARWSHLAVTSLGLAGLFALGLACNPLRWMRLIVFLDPQAHRQGAGWQIWQGLIAIGCGGLWGRCLDGSIHQYGFVPEQQTDYLFTCVGEETGWWGATLVLLLFLGAGGCGLYITKHARDRFGRFLAAGCTLVITLQAGLNIAVNTSLVPCKGLPLPFMSYGGSGLLAMFICAGLLGGVACHSPAASPHCTPK